MMMAVKSSRTVQVQLLEIDSSVGSSWGRTQRSYHGRHSVSFRAFSALSWGDNTAARVRWACKYDEWP